MSLDGTFTATDADFVSKWRALAADEPIIDRPISDGFDVVIESNVSQDQFQLLRSEETSRAVRVPGQQTAASGKMKTYHAFLP